jgi:hypothetical protein
MTEIKLGSVGISGNSHSLLVSLVFDESLSNEDRPFTSIVEAFRFAFALGYTNNLKSEKSGKNVTVAPRQFIVNDYLHLLSEEISQTNKSLGGLISEYAEGGCKLIFEHIEKNNSLYELI